jgi:hypothetical protein
MADVRGSIARLRLPIARATPPVAVVYGIGIYWIVWSLAVGLLVAASLFVRLPVSGLYLPAAAALGSAAAIAVTLRSGGWLAAAALALLGLVYGLSLACQSTLGTGGPSCDLGPFFSTHVGELVGGFVGLPLGLAFQKRGGRSTLLLTAAIIAIAIPLLRIVFVPLGPLTGSDAHERHLWTIRLEAAAAFAAGAVLAAMARRSGLGLLLLGAALLLPWLGGLRTWWEDWQFLHARGIDLNLNVIVQIEWQSVLPLIYFALVLFGFAIERVFGAVRRNIAEHRVRNSDGGVPPHAPELIDL